MKPSFVTWQLRRLHTELDGIDKRRGAVPEPAKPAAGPGREPVHDRAARRILLYRLMRSLPKRLGFRDARAFVHAFARANELAHPASAARRRLTARQIRELERRVLANERPAHIAQAIGCAEQTVLNRASQLRKRLAALAEEDASGI